MRNRFFLIILVTLIMGVGGIGWIVNYFFENERLELIDRQLDRTLTALLASSDFRKAITENKDVDDTITKLIGSNRIGKIFILADKGGSPIYQGGNKRYLPFDLPTSPDRVTVRGEAKYVRLFNTKLESGAVFQLGLVMDPNFVHWRIFDRDTVALITLLAVLVFAMAAVLTIVLLAPIRQLNSHLGSATADLSNLRDVDPLPSGLKDAVRGIGASSDEFTKLVTTVDRLIDRINRNYKLTRSWTFQLAHELKTPLAIIRAETEAQSAAGRIPASTAKKVLEEVDSTTETIGQFLGWAELENTDRSRPLHVTKACASVEAKAKRFADHWKRKVRIDCGSDFSVAAGEGHFDQLVTNLLTNAFKYSPPETQVDVWIGDHRLEIVDRGPGIPREVLAKIGQPFNVGTHEANRRSRGSGLGLAWANTVAKVYDWKLAIDSTSGGTSIEVTFPKLD